MERPGRRRAGLASGSYWLQHRVAAMLAEEVLVGAHADDGLVLATVLAGRDELVAAQAEDAAVAAGQLRRAQPGLAAPGTPRPRNRGFLPGLHQGSPRRMRAMKKPSLRSRSGRVWRKRGSRADASAGSAAPRSSAAASRRAAIRPLTTSSFSVAEI